MSLSSYTSREYASIVLNGQVVTASTAGNLLVGGAGGAPGFVLNASNYSASSLQNGATFFSSSSSANLALPAPVLGANFNVVIGNTAGIAIASNAANVWGTYTNCTNGTLSITAAKTTVTFASGLAKVGDSVSISSDGSKYYINAFSGATGGIVLA